VPLRSGQRIEDVDVLRVGLSDFLRCAVRTVAGTSLTYAEWWHPGHHNERTAMPFKTTAARNRARKRIIERVKAGEPCVFCRQPIPLDAKYPHPLALVADHRIPTSRGGTDHYGDGDLIRPAHNKCNRTRSNHADGSVGRNSGVLG
jgi:hypothetical protein